MLFSNRWFLLQSYNIVVRFEPSLVRIYPEICVTHYLTEVPLQSLVDHTVSRIVECQPDVFQHNNNGFVDRITMIYKWGCDRNSDHSTYRQSCADFDNRMNGKDI